MQLLKKEVTRIYLFPVFVIVLEQNYFSFQVLSFVDFNGNDVLSLGSMVKVSEETIRNILCRETLDADEFVKFQVILRVYNVQCTI